MKRLILLVLSGVTLFGCGDDSVNADQEPSIEFVTSPSQETDHNISFSYSYRAESEGSGDITYQVLEIPPWIENDHENNRLSGVPGWENKETTFTIRIEASDGVETVTQSKDVTVTFANIICNQDFGDPNNSTYILPFRAGVSSEIMQSYCNPSNSHNNTFAYDFLLDMGEDIIASRGGTAVQVQDGFPDGNGTSGEENFVYIEHDDGSVIRYVHLMQNSVPFAEGTKVSQGTVIGKNGLSGGTPRPHLHFELFREFTWSDKRFAIPINFKNAEGDLDSNNGLIVGKVYSAK